jgi:anthranilate 1,2-dioxygenase reductase subunit
MTYKVALNFSDGKTAFFDVHANELLLDAALRNGVNIPLDCREGVCGTCQGRCEFGTYTQDYVDEETLSEDDLAQRKMLSCQTRVQSDASFYFDFDSSLCQGGGTHNVSARVEAVELVSETTAILHIDANAYDIKIDFLPGQYARLKVPGTDEWRSYSFAHHPNAHNKLQFLIRLLPDGAMSNYLRERCVRGAVGHILSSTVRTSARDGCRWHRSVRVPRNAR